MFSHVMVGTNDFDRAKAFYDSVLGVLGASPGNINEAATGHKRAFWFHNGGIFAISQPINDAEACVANGSTIGFACDSLEQVQAFHDAAVAAGRKSDAEVERPFAIVAMELNSLGSTLYANTPEVDIVEPVMEKVSHVREAHPTVTTFRARPAVSEARMVSRRASAWPVRLGWAAAACFCAFCSASHASWNRP